MSSTDFLAEIPNFTQTPEVSTNINTGDIFNNTEGSPDQIGLHPLKGLRAMLTRQYLLKECYAPEF